VERWFHQAERTISMQSTKTGSSAGGDRGRVAWEERGSTVQLTFDNPSAHNAMTWLMYEQLSDACDRLAERPDVRAVVFRGAGTKAFVAGTDIQQFLEFKTIEAGLEYERTIEGILQRIERLPMPTLAVLRGHVVGGGFMIAAACDLRLCTDDVSFAIPIARTLGNCLSVANHARVLSMIGPARTKKLIIGGYAMGADEALRCGLATAVVEETALEERVQDLTRRLIGQAPLTVWATKESIRRLAGEHAEDGPDVIEKIYGSSDFAEGVAAFVERRDPSWVGR
jgi:enoyl-CoA hydratase